jgi:hypothetical protein
VAGARLLEPACSRPAAVAVEDDGDVRRKRRALDLLAKACGVQAVDGRQEEIAEPTARTVEPYWTRYRLPRSDRSRVSRHDAAARGSGNA